MNGLRRINTAIVAIDSENDGKLRGVEGGARSHLFARVDEPAALEEVLAEALAPKHQ